jgi:hypothetical protein
MSQQFSNPSSLEYIKMEVTAVAIKLKKWAVF